MSEIDEAIAIVKFGQPLCCSERDAVIEVLERLKAENAELRKAQEWIPKQETDCGPEEQILIRSDNCGDFIGNWLTSGDFWDIDGERTISARYVTHVHPLPLEPTDEGGE